MVLLKRFFFAVFALALVFGAKAASLQEFAADATPLPPPVHREVLVIVDSFSVKSTHSQFFSFLERKNYNLHFFMTDDDDLTLKEHGEYLYEHIIFFAPKSEEHVLSVDDFIQFIDSGRNLIIAADIGVSEFMIDLAVECGVYFDEASGSLAIDHFNYDLSDSMGQHSLIVVDNVASDVPVILGGKEYSSPLLFRGVAMATENNDRIHKLLSGYSTTYSHAPTKKIKEYPHTAGKDTALVVAMHARNNARVVFSGSLELFCNDFFGATVQRNADKTAKPSSNRQFSQEIATWVFQERGLLHAREATHHLLGDDSQMEPKEYKVKDEVVYSIKLEEWDAERNTYKPYKADNVQLEFTMLSPFIRKTMTHDGRGNYTVSFQTPDKFGIFKFVIYHARKGYSIVDVSTKIPLRPFRHDEYERFIPSAYPYYSAILVSMLCFFIFCIAFLFSSFSPKKKD